MGMANMEQVEAEPNVYQGYVTRKVYDIFELRASSEEEAYEILTGPYLYDDERVAIISEAEPDDCDFEYEIELKQRGRSAQEILMARSIREQIDAQEQLLLRQRQIEESEANLSERD